MLSKENFKELIYHVRLAITGEEKGCGIYDAINLLNKFFGEEEVIFRWERYLYNYRKALLDQCSKQKEFGPLFGYELAVADYEYLLKYQ